MSPVGGSKPKKEREAPRTSVHFELAPELVKSLDDAIAGRPLTLRRRKELQHEMQYRYAIPLPFVRLPWTEVEAEAERQGCSPADIVFDRARAKDQ